MTLFENMFEQFSLLEKQRTPDGAGGFLVEYVDKGTFEAVVVMNSSMQARIAEREGVTSVYTVTTRKNVALDFHDVIRRESDSAIFRITSIGTDIQSPNFASFDIKQMQAERWVLTQ